MRFSGFFSRNARQRFAGLAALTLFAAGFPLLAEPPKNLTPEELAKAGQLVREMARAHAQKAVQVEVETTTIRQPETPVAVAGKPGQEVEENVTGSTIETFDTSKNQIIRTTVIKKVERLPAPAGFQPPAPKPSLVAEPERPVIPDSTWLQERAKVAPLPSRFPYHPEKAVAIIPFVNRTKAPGAPKHVHEETAKVFAKLGFEIIPESVVRNVMTDLHQAVGVPLNTREAARLAKALRARYLVTGLVHEYKTENNLRAGALLSTGIIGGGLTAYGKCRIESQLFDADRKRFIWENKAIGSAKKQLIGWAQGRDTLYNHSVQRAVRDVYQPLELLKTVPNHPSALSEFQRMRTLDPEFPVEWFNRVYR